MATVPPPFGDILSAPTQVVDDDDDANLATGNTNYQRRQQESQQGIVDVTGYQNNRHQLEEEVWYRRELEQKEIELQRYQVALQEKEEIINQITQQYEHQLHLFKVESGSEKERLQQKYENMSRYYSKIMNK